VLYGFMSDLDGCMKMTENKKHFLRAQWILGGPRGTVVSMGVWCHATLKRPRFNPGSTVTAFSFQEMVVDQ
jgi:hypothetical protein